MGNAGFQALPDILKLLVQGRAQEPMAEQAPSWPTPGDSEPPCTQRSPTLEEEAHQCSSYLSKQRQHLGAG